MNSIKVSTTSTLKTLGIASAIALLAACGGGGGGGSDNTSGNNMGRLSVALTDAPVDSLQSVVITVTGVSIKPQNGEAQTISLTTPKVIDLLDLQNGAVQTLLDDYSVTAGSYEWIRLELSTADNALYVENEVGGMVGLRIPSGFESGLKLNTGFTVPQGGDANFTIDFDLRKSVHKPNGQADYFLKPSLRLIDNTNVGTLSGTVSPTLLQLACDNTGEFAGLVYVYNGTGVLPDDYDGTAPEAIAAGKVALDNNGNYSYKVPFLAAGGYTVAFSCDLDDSAVDETLMFHQPQTATVTTNTTTTINFQ
jgi:hypothetical protein